ncbi:Na+/H+ antiporter [Yamadazyma tenuis]|uniref:Na+/H+ antiporter n=1 Tax=Candida tenuis TaxID=2315449 RepID=UPI0027A3695F|nr:Na+/H+ antiporter [Yamadazyma tenuis]
MVWSQLELEDSHIAYACVGVFCTLFSLVSLFVKEKLYIGEATVASIAGLILGPHCLNWFDPLSWGESEVITLEISRIVLCVQIVAVAVELPKKYMKKHWLSVAILLLPVMTAGWLTVGLFVWVLIPHFSFSEALLVSACVTATDPVLAAAVVGKGKFAERVPGHLRNLLSAESGCNDGMAFPFIFLSLNLLIHPGNAGEIAKDWILNTILYQCVFGCILGGVLGYALRKLVALAERRNIIDRESFLAFFVFLAFNSAGFGSILGVDDLLVSFAAGTAFGWNGDFAKKTEESHVSTVIDLIINLAFFVYFGAIIPWEEFNNAALGLNVWRLVVLAFVIIFLRRLPAVVALKPFTPDIKSWREAIFCGHFGPIGVGAIFAVILARKDLEEHYIHESSLLDTELGEEVPYHQLLNTLWPITNFIVITSIVVHGSSVAVLTLGKRLNRMAITMTFTNTTANEESPNWLSRLQKLERSTTSFSLHRVDSDATTLGPSGLSEDDTERLRHTETIETSGIKYRPAGGARRKKQRRKRKSRKSNLIKTLSGRSHDGRVEEVVSPDRPRPPNQFLQLGKPSTTLTSDHTDKLDDDEDADEEFQPTTSESSPQSKEHHNVEATAFQEGSNIVIEDTDGEVIESLAIKQGKQHGQRENGTDITSLHSMESLQRHMTQLSSASDESSSQVSKSENSQMPGIMRTITGDSRKAYYKRDDPSHRKVYAHQIDDVLLIENEDGDIIRKYKVSRHHAKSESNRSRSTSYVDKALSLVGIKKSAPISEEPDLEKSEQFITPEYDSGAPELQNRKVEQQVENHLHKVLSNKRKNSAVIPIPEIREPPVEEEEEEEEEEDEEASEDSEFDDSEDDDDDDLEETEVERTRRLAALGQLSANRDEDDEEE